MNKIFCNLLKFRFVWKVLKIRNNFSGCKELIYATIVAALFIENQSLLLWNYLKIRNN